jgi:DNA helicase-2/ATP-dependent DNA helicase PcrA
VRLEKYSNGILTHDDFCILVRINSHSRPYESALNEMKIPYRMVIVSFCEMESWTWLINFLLQQRGGLRFFDRAEVKDVIAYLRLVSNPYDSEAFTRIINVPKRGIGDVTVKRIKALAERKHLSMLDALAEFANTGGGSSANRSLPQATVNEMGRFLKMMNSFRALAEAQVSLYLCGRV